VTNAATLAITNQPQAGANATLTNSMALWVQAGLTKLDGILQTASGRRVAQTSKTTTYPITTSDETIFCDPTTGGAGFTVTLPTPVGIAGQTFTIKHMSATFTVTVATAAGLIDGVASWALLPKNSMTVVSDGSNWGIV
jgi:hypothetical protein